MEIPPLTREQVRSIDRKAIDEYGMSGLVLMENAGRACAETLCNLGIHGKVIIVCGTGNNGGDGFVMARHLGAQGIWVEVVALQRTAAPQDIKTLATEALANLHVLNQSAIEVISMSEDYDLRWFAARLVDAEWIVDALLGTGTMGNPRSHISKIISWMNGVKRNKLAIDLPSGLDCDTGIPGTPTFRADHTCTFVAPKVGFTNPMAKEFLGTVSVHDIGVPRKLLEEFAS